MKMRSSSRSRWATVSNGSNKSAGGAHQTMLVCGGLTEKPSCARPSATRTVLTQRVEACGGEDARLAPASTVKLAEVARTVNVLAASAEHRADRRAEAFGEAHAHGVEMAGKVRRCVARGCACIP
eukprot:6187915-Pleurochrysis_carterae.AAC.2